MAFASSQLSDRAAARWQRQPRLSRALFGAADLVLAVDQTQADRLTALGATNGTVQVGGSLKLPAAASKPDQGLVTMLRKAAGKRRILLAASTHPGEDEVVIDAADQLAQVVHHHRPAASERGSAIRALCVCRPPISQRSTGASATSGDVIHIADTLGEMDSLFAASRLSFLAARWCPAADIIRWNRGLWLPDPERAAGLQEPGWTNALPLPGWSPPFIPPKTLPAGFDAAAPDRLAKIEAAGRAHAAETESDRQTRQACALS